MPDGVSDFVRWSGPVVVAGRVVDTERGPVRAAPHGRSGSAGRGCRPAPREGQPDARPGDETWRIDLPHGVDPAAIARRAGARGLPRAGRDEAGRLVLSYDVTSPEPPDPRPAPAARPRRAPGLVVAPGERAVPVQRVSASVLVWADGALLATRYVDRPDAVAPGAWALPGGGVDPGEEPIDAARRECWEEAGQVVQVGALLRLTSRHWVGRSPAGRLEDFHALALVYEARCPEPTTPVVHDVGGSTAQAAWVGAADVPGLGWSVSQRWVGSTRPPTAPAGPVADVRGRGGSAGR